MRLIIVEDEVELANGYLSLFEDEFPSLESVVCYSVEQARDELDHPTDIVITDYALHDGTGETVARLAKQRHPRCRVLLQSAIVTAANVEELRAERLIDESFVKPMDLNLLIGLVRGWVEGTKA